MMGVTIVFNVQCAMTSAASALVSVLMIAVMFRIRWLTEKDGSSGVYDMIFIGMVCLTVHVVIRLGV